MEHTDRLQLEPLGHEHAEGIVAALSDEAVSRYIGGPDVTTVEAFHRRIEALAAGPGRPDEHWLNFAVRLRSDDVIVGRVEATTYGEWGEIAYVFGPAFGGNGYATEATTWLMEYLARNGVRELWAAVLPDNERSIALLRRLGFQLTSPDRRALGSFDEGDLAFVFDGPTTTGSDPVAG